MEMTAAPGAAAVVAATNKSTPLTSSDPASTSSSKGPLLDQLQQHAGAGADYVCFPEQQDFIQEPWCK